MKMTGIVMMCLLMAACSEATMTSPAPDNTPVSADAKSQTATPDTTPAVPILSLLVGNSVTPSARAKWCLKEGSVPFSKIVIQDESIAAPLENENAPLSGHTTAKSTPTKSGTDSSASAAATTGTASIIRQSGDSSFTLQWLSAGKKGTAAITIQNGDALNWDSTDGSATFSHCAP